MIKLIVSDVDGTLVKDGTLEINPEYMDVIKKLREKEIYFAVCSGRQYSSESQLFCTSKRPDFFCIRWRDADSYLRKNTENPHAAGRDLEKHGQNGKDRSAGM